MAFVEYQWIVGVGAVLCVFMAYGIGANDTANSFGTSVGSRALTIRQAPLVAAVCEMAGALGLGANVTDTIRGGILSYEDFTSAPEVLMFGMMCSLAAAGIFMVFATLLEMPVSTTHAVIGAIIGFGLVAHGKDAVQWVAWGKPGEFPIQGVVGIVISWVFSPVCSGILASFFFLCARTFVLRHNNSYIRSWISLPVWVFLTVSIDVLFMVMSGAKHRASRITTNQAIAIGLGTGAGVACIVALLIRAVLKPRAETVFKGRMQKGEIVQDPNNPHWYVFDQARIKELEAERRRSAEGAEEANTRGRLSSAVKTIFHGLDQDVHAVVDTDEHVGAVHATAEVFDARTEESFRYLQVFTAMSMSFAHGANDIANAVGPMAAIYFVYKNGVVKKSTDQSTESALYWILFLGGVGIWLGLATLGYIIMRTLGVKVAKMTASRGFAAELGPALIVVIGSKLSLPLSTTHCVTGSVVGIGMTERSRGVNYYVLPRIIAGWVLTLVVAGGGLGGAVLAGLLRPRRVRHPGPQLLPGAAAAVRRKRRVGCGEHRVPAHVGPLRPHLVGHGHEPQPYRARPGQDPGRQPVRGGGDARDGAGPADGRADGRVPQLPAVGVVVAGLEPTQGFASGACSTAAFVELPESSPAH